jgi:tRNA A-37 threonylcarbamoyl transferase component Bud32
LNELCHRTEPFAMCSRFYEGWNITVDKHLSDQNIQRVYASIDQLPTSNRIFRRRGIVPLSTSDGTHHVYVKCNMVRHFSMSLLQMLHAFRMIANGRLLKEGDAYVEYRSRGIPTATLLLYGDYKIFGIRTKEMIVTEVSEGENIKKRYIVSGDHKYIYHSVEFLANLHNHGMVHGDCMLHNFFILDNNEMILLDLEESSFLTEQLQLNDLTAYGASVLRITGSISLLNSVITHYESLLKSKIMVGLSEIVHRSIEEIKKTPYASMYKPQC